MNEGASSSPSEHFRLCLQTQDTPDQPIYAIGNFNGWRVADERYRMQDLGDNRFELPLVMADLPPILEYKYAQGSWDHVELDQHGHDRPNRQVAKIRGHSDDHVHQWKRTAFAYRSEYLPIIDTIAESDLQLPEEIRTRRIAALLPHDYYQTDQRYPVLYLQDGQNLFDDYAPYGNWAVDKRLAQLQEQGHGDVIIIAIDHAADKRIVEFTPTNVKTRFGAGQGRRYARFLAESLKPYIDQRFRTEPDFQHTAIGGSSMGGLISIYAGMMYPNVFGRLLIFSPALWVTPNIPFQLLQNIKTPYHGRVYLYGGKKESANMVPNLRRLQAAMEAAGTNEAAFELAIDPEGEHNEARWGIEFPKALRWLFFNS
ncbi:MAG: alpha/beta hydrolase-fold protein [Bacteroidota bacterium]